MGTDVKIQDFIKTKKQKAFENDFFKNAANYERWEDVDDEGWVDGQIQFEVELEDVLTFAEGVVDDNPLFTDVEAAKNGPFGELIAHPMFLTQIIFWSTGRDGRGSWIKTPGAINPGHEVEFGVPIRPGDIIRQRSRFHDKYIKRGKRYLSFETYFLNQNDELVCKWLGGLILPVSREGEAHKFL
ncbi:MAG: hypothetical protein NPIRA05_13000 [Nitrospirales bacterium]|nr:MAG: hypothetical protein NPIRA05_13000 [Nitrospirales bacterium]